MNSFVYKWPLRLWQCARPPIRWAKDHTNRSGTRTENGKIIHWNDFHKNRIALPTLKAWENDSYHVRQSSSNFYFRFFFFFEILCKMLIYRNCEIESISRTHTFQVAPIVYDFVAIDKCLSIHVIRVMFEFEMHSRKCTSCDLFLV